MIDKSKKKNIKQYCLIVQSVEKIQRVNTEFFKNKKRKNNDCML